MSVERARIVAVLLGLGAAGCGDDLPDPPGAGGSSSSTTGTIDTSTTDGSTSTSTSAAPASSDEAGTTTGTTGPSSVGIPDECTVSADCVDGEPFCVAPFDQSAGPEGKGAYECVSECVVLMDEDRWCADAAACCDPQAECTDRGYCVYPEESTGGSEGSGSSDGSTGGSTG
jgi:hypothetical protein